MDDDNDNNRIIIIIIIINRLLLSSSEEDVYKNFVASCDCLLGINIILCVLLWNKMYGRYLCDRPNFILT
jgi:hypothetical protein